MMWNMVSLTMAVAAIWLMPSVLCNFEDNLEDQYIELQEEIIAETMDHGDNGVDYSVAPDKCRRVAELREQIVDAGKAVCDLDDPKVHELCKAEIDLPTDCDTLEKPSKRKRALYGWVPRWHGGVVPYTFSETTADKLQQEQIRAAMLLYERYTCFRMIPWTVDENGTTTNEKLGMHNGRLNFIKGGGCYAVVSSGRGSHSVSCCASWRFACVHEIGHALNLAHEQSNPDPNRNLMIRVGKADQALGGDQTAVGYDSTSFMHYPGYNKGFREMHIGQDVFPNSFYMMKELSIGIKCDEVKCPDFNMTCDNEGYVTTVDGKCACMCYDGLDPDTGCRKVISSQTSTQAWPGGSYALPSPAGGCADAGATPGEAIHFNDGGNEASSQFDLKGGVDGQKITQSFCVTEGSSSEDVWPPGDYCIYRKGGECPSSFKGSFVQFDNSQQALSQSGALPDGVFGEDLRLEYCCKGDGWYNEEIFLPNSKPFVLIKNGPACQRVRGMNAYVQSYTINNPVNGTANVTGEGEVPDTPLKTSDDWKYTIEFCYYKPADMNCGGVHTLSADNPSVTFSSPAGTDRRCTWLIKVPKDEKIRLEFQKFNISGSNDRGLGEIASGHGKYCTDRVDIRAFRPGQLGHIYCGDKLDRTIVSTNSTMAVHLFAREASSEFTATATIVQNKDLCYDAADHGTTYAGNVNFTRFFKPCLPWTDAVKCQYNPYSVDKGKNNVRLEGNFCRNPDFTTGVMPWCYTQGCDIGYCDTCLVAGDGSQDIAKGISVTPIAAVTCGDPPSVADAIITKGLSGGPYKVGSKVTYSCNQTAALSEGHEHTKVRKCLTSGEWSDLGYVCDVCPDGWHWDKATRQCYGFINKPTSMGKAVEACKSLGMKIAMPKSLEINKIMRSLTTHSMWVPASDEEVEGTFYWSDGSLLGSKFSNGSWNGTWSYWSGSEPNDWGWSGEDCVVMGGDGGWNDIHCDYNYGYVCVGPELKPPVCADFSNTCQSLFIADPSVCEKHDEFAERICPATCGKCDADKNACSVPTTPENAVSVRGQTGTVTPGDYIEHRCNAGYKVESGDTRRACLADGSLTGSAMKCVESCPSKRQEGWHWDLDSKECYGFYKKTVPMQKAIDECKSIGMTAALPKTADKNAILRSLSSDDMWVHASDKETEGTFIWADGTVLGTKHSNGSWTGNGWSNWGGSEPNDWGWGEDCAIMRWNGAWNDRSCGSSFSYVCVGPVITPPPCEDVKDTCQSEFVADPTVCSDRVYAEDQCPKTCGTCQTEITGCDVSTVPDNAETVPEQSKTSIDVGEYIEYKCRDGYMQEKGDLVRSCLSDGTLSGEAVECIQSCPDGWLYSGPPSRLCYYHIVKGLDYSQAKKSCEKLNTTLAMPKTKQEDDKIREIMELGNAPWWTYIGLDDIELEDSFVWIDGTPIEQTWNNWAGSEPNNMWGNEDCAMTGGYSAPYWEDRRCGGKGLAVCQVKLENIKDIPAHDCQKYGYHKCEDWN